MAPMLPPNRKAPAAAKLTGAATDKPIKESLLANNSTYADLSNARCHLAPSSLSFRMQSSEVA